VESSSSKVDLAKDVENICTDNQKLAEEIKIKGKSRYLCLCHRQDTIAIIIQVGDVI
jgi:hypothetical protein